MERKARMFSAPGRPQNMPDCLHREPITVLQPASITPEPMKKPWRRKATAACLLSQEGPKPIDGTEGRDISGRFIVPDRVAFFIAFVLRKHTAQIGHACLGLAVLLFAGPPLEFLFAHRDASGIAAD